MEVVMSSGNSRCGSNEDCGEGNVMIDEWVALCKVGGEVGDAGIRTYIHDGVVSESEQAWMGESNKREFSLCLC